MGRGEITSVKQGHIFLPSFQVTKKDRQRLHAHNSYILWFTGLSGAGKSTIANDVEHKLHRMGVSTYILDGDNLRHGLNHDLDFSPKDRTENNRRAGEVAKLLVDSGIIVLATLISPCSGDRKIVREMVEPNEFIEIYVKCSLEKCEERDAKGLYQKAKKGEIKEFTGISAFYEIPVQPEITVDTENSSVEECSMKIIEFMINMQLYISPSVG